jgi:hypothetical protein
MFDRELKKLGVASKLDPSPKGGGLMNPSYPRSAEGVHGRP